MTTHTAVIAGLRINPKKHFFINIFQNPLSECEFPSTHSINTEKSRRISFFPKKLFTSTILQDTIKYRKYFPKK